MSLPIVRRTVARPAFTRRVLMCATVAAMAAQPALAQSTWNGGTGTWNTAANWTPNAVPASNAATQLVFDSSDATGYTTTHNIGTGTFTLNRITVNNTGSGTVTINAAATGNTLTLGGTTPTIDITGRTVFSGRFVGGATATLTKIGTGTFVHDSDNQAFTGTLIVNAGRFVNDATVNPTTNFNPVSIVVNDGGIYQFGVSGAGNPNLPNSTYITVNSGGNVVWEEGEDFGGFVVAGGSLTYNGFNSNVNGSTPTELRSGTVTSATNNGIAGTGVVNKTTAGTVTFNGAILNNSGGINIQDGVLATNSGFNTTGNLTFGTNGAGATSGTFRFTGATPATAVSKPIVLNEGGGTIDISDASTVFTYGGVATGAGPLTKAGPGSLVVTGANTFTGPVTVAGGTFQIGAGGTAGAITNTSITVAAGATLAFNRSDSVAYSNPISGAGNLLAQHAAGTTLRLTGPLTHTGMTTVTSGTLRVAPFNAAGGITVGDTAGLTLAYTAASTPLTTPTLSLGSGGSTLTLALNTATNPTAALINVTGTDGLSLNGGMHSLAVTNAQGLQVGTIPLIKYAGADVTDGFTLTGLPARTLGGLVYNTAAKQVELNVTAVDSIVWNGNLNATWDEGTGVGVGGTNNFRLASDSSATNFIPGDQVRFDDTLTGPAGSRTVTLAAPLAASSVTVNTTGTYTFTGAGNLTGSASLTKQGAGELVIATNNDNTGTTTVSGGTLRVGTGGATGSIGSGDVVNNGVIVVDRSDDLTIPGNVSGTGSLTKQGTNTLTIGGAYGATGDMTVVGGSVAFASNTSFVYSGRITGSGAVSKSGAGTATLAGNNTYAGGTTVTGGILNVGDGGTSGAIGAGDITITAPTGGSATLAFNRSDTTTITNNISISGGVLAHTGTGTTTLAGTVTQNAVSPGTIRVDAGTLVLPNADTTGYIGAVRAEVNGTITWDTTSGDQTYGNNFAGSGTLRKVGPGTVTLTGDNAFNGTLIIDAGTVALTDPLANVGTNGDIDAVSIVVNNGATFQFGQGGTTGENPDLPDVTFINVNAGGTSVSRVGEQYGGVNLNGGTLLFDGAAYSGVSTQQNWTSGTVTTPAGATANVASGGGAVIVKTTPGTVTVSGRAQIGPALNIQEGTIAFATNNNLTGSAVQLGTATTTGAFEYQGDTASRAGNFTLNGAGTVRVTQSAAALTLSGVMSGVGNLTKEGTGTLRLTGNNTFSGGTTVAAGTLEVANTAGSGTGTGPVTVATGATLRGTGTISGVLSIAGTLAPGSSPGRLTAGNDVTLGASSFLSVELGKLIADANAPVAGTDYDQLAMTRAAGLLTIEPGAKLAVIEQPNLAPGQVFTIIDNTNGGTITGTFTSPLGDVLGEGATFTGDQGTLFQISYANGDVTLTAGIPEPTSIGVAGLAAAGLLARRRSRRRA